MGSGYSRMNDLTVIQSTQGLASYLLSLPPASSSSPRTVVIGHDHRHNSFRFARLTAACFLYRGFKVLWFGDGMTPQLVHTPLVPFTVMKRSADAGIMITASHNPAADNGYKLYASNACQIISPVDAHVSREILENLVPWEREVDNGSASTLNGHKHEPGPLPFASVWDETRVAAELARGEDNAWVENAFEESVNGYFAKVAELCAKPKANSNPPSTLSLTYTPMHGVGSPFALRALSTFSFPVSASFPNLVPLQDSPDPDFSTVAYPNPEEGKGALKLAMDVADRVGGQRRYIVANDPDADRLAVAERRGEEWVVYSGNQIGCMLAAYSLEKWRERNTAAATSNIPAFLATAVSSRLLSQLCLVERVEYHETLTGFKWIGNRAAELQASNREIAFAYEEAIGFMCGGGFVRDKDGVSALAVFAELAVQLENKGMGAGDYLDSIYEKYGDFVSETSYFICRDPAKMALICDRMRFGGEVRDWIQGGQKIPRIRAYPSTITAPSRPDLPLTVTRVRDLTEPYDSASPPPAYLPTLPTSRSSQMITFGLSAPGGLTGWVTLRTSGTEPKMKYYVEGWGEAARAEDKREAGKKIVVDFVGVMVEAVREDLERSTITKFGVQQFSDPDDAVLNFELPPKEVVMLVNPTTTGALGTPSSTYMQGLSFEETGTVPMTHGLKRDREISGSIERPRKRQPSAMEPNHRSPIALPPAISFSAGSLAIDSGESGIDMSVSSTREPTLVRHRRRLSAPAADPSLLIRTVETRIGNGGYMGVPPSMNHAEDLLAGDMVGYRHAFGTIGRGATGHSDFTSGDEDMMEVDGRMEGETLQSALDWTLCGSNTDINRDYRVMLDVMEETCTPDASAPEPPRFAFNVESVDPSTAHELLNPIYPTLSRFHLSSESHQTPSLGRPSLSLKPAFANHQPSLPRSTPMSGSGMDLDASSNTSTSLLPGNRPQADFVSLPRTRARSSSPKPLPVLADTFGWSPVGIGWGIGRSATLEKNRPSDLAVELNQEWMQAHRQRASSSDESLGRVSNASGGSGSNNSSINSSISNDGMAQSLPRSAGESSPPTSLSRAVTQRSYTSPGGRSGSPPSPYPTDVDDDLATVDIGVSDEKKKFATLSRSWNRGKKAYAVEDDTLMDSASVVGDRDNGSPAMPDRELWAPGSRPSAPANGGPALGRGDEDMDDKSLERRSRSGGMTGVHSTTRQLPGGVGGITPFLSAAAASSARHVVSGRAPISTVDMWNAKGVYNNSKDKGVSSSWNLIGGFEAMRGRKK
ncbi:Phosphoglucomutase-3 [Gonapodya sp. JEL0774]|nr:Phosphoglucomutase-3 [Gonapodya sp. JEL0774]